MHLDNSTIVWPPPSTAIDFEDFAAMLDSDPNLPSGPGSITWRVNGERILVFAWGRAILMQIAHPLVAEGVAHHSNFSTSLTAKVGRFWRTLMQMLRLTFGTRKEVWQAARAIDNIHARVHGEREEAPAVRYSARDIELLKWVHVTFVDSILKAYSLFVRPLSDVELDDYIYKASIIGPLMGAPRGYFPENLAEFNAYLESVLSNNTLHIDAQTRELAKYVLDGVPLPLLANGANGYLRLCTAVMLPEQLRDAYGLSATRWGVTVFNITTASSRIIHSLLPAPLRRWSLANQAEAKAKIRAFS
jgi:uncharacterized protein (DUF2236 family)